MKVLHIGKYFSPFKGGVENYMLDVMGALHHEGVECAALVHQHEPVRRSSTEMFDYGRRQSIVVRAGVWLRLLFTPISPAFPGLLRSLLQSFRPDVLHIHMPNPSAVCALFSARARELPWVLHWHSDVVASSPLMRLARAFYRPFERKMLRRADLIVATSPAYRESSESLRPFLDKCRVVTLGIDRGRIESAFGPGPQHDASGSQDALAVLAVGRLTYYKGFEHLIRAAAKSAAVQVGLVGSGDEEARLRELVSRLGLEDRVIFHGALSARELLGCLSRCDCLCLPSIERTEAFGIVLLEAMFFGKAAVVTDVAGSGMSWVVEDGVNGMVVRAGDPDDLARALNFMHDNRELMSAMGRRGQDKFERHFEIGQSASRLRDIYQGLLSQDRD
jgi:rhamnosyl/mannosyltransferase